MRDPGSGRVDLTSWTLVSWLCACPGPHVEKQGGLGTQRGYLQHSLSLALELSRALCVERDAKVSFSKHVCSFPGLTETPHNIWGRQRKGEEASKAQSVAY